MTDKPTANKSLFEEGMIPGFKVEIELSNPKRASDLKNITSGESRSGYSRHKSYVLSDGTYRRFSLGDEIVYRLARLHFRDELSFNTITNSLEGGLSELRFRIGSKSKWTFHKTSFKFSKEGSNDEELAKIIQFKFDPAKPKEAIVRVLGDELNTESEINYTLQYCNEEGELEIHDPRIRNGHGAPILPTFGVTSSNIGQALREYLKDTTVDDLEFMLSELRSLLDESS